MRLRLLARSKKWFDLLALFCWGALIFILSSQSKLPGPADDVADLLFKKTAHMVVYGVLFFLSLRAFSSARKVRYLEAFIFCVLYAISDEIHQSFVPGRTPMLTDIGFDMVGVGICYGVVKKFKLFLSTGKV